MKLTGKTAALISPDGLPTIHISAGVVLVGRSSECDVLIDSKRISRKHCCIALVGEKLVIKDLGSTNGCRVNGERSDELNAREGDEIMLGDAVYQFRWDHPSSETIRPIAASAIADDDDPVIEPTTQRAPDNNKERQGSSKLDSSDPMVHLSGLA